jgi:phospholipid/cholesterol/gamma-HCH transport system substrate-binding protein
MPRTVRLGMFVLGALSILAVGIFLIGSHQGLFQSGYTLKAAFANVSGLQNGAEVRVGGIDEGTVKLIQLPTKPGEKVTVVMSMAKPTRSVIKRDSSAAIRTEGMVGAKFVEISFGSEDAPPVHDGDTIPSEAPVDFGDLLKKASTIMDSTSVLTSHLADAAVNMDAITGKINGGKGSLGQLVNDPQMYKDLNTTTQQAAEGAAAFKDNMQALQHNFLLRGFFNKRGYTDAADLSEHEIGSLPTEQYLKTFSYDSRQLFDKAGSAKLKSPQALNEAGDYLQNNRFGLAVIVAYTGGKGDSEKDKTLTEARSMLVRDYLVKNFSIANDAQLKTMGVGKDAPAGGDSDGGIEILVYPVGSTAADGKSTELSSDQ